MGIIRHECISPSFPDAWEHEFPLSEINGGGVPEAVVACIGCDQKSAEAALIRRLADIKTPEVREFTRMLDGMCPCSVMVQGQKCWLVLKRPEHATSPTQSGNTILVPALPQQRLQWPPEMASDFAKADHMIEFFEHFGGLTLQVPPAGYCVSCNDKLRPMHETSFPGLGEWQGCLPFFYPGNGDVMLARPDGSAGVWQHEFSSSYDKSAGPGLSSLLKSFQWFLPNLPEPEPLPPDCVKRCDHPILVEVRKEIQAVMARR